MSYGVSFADLVAQSCNPCSRGCVLRLDAKDGEYFAIPAQEGVS